MHRREVDPAPTWDEVGQLRAAMRQLEAELVVVRAERDQARAREQELLQRIRGDAPRSAP